MQPSSAATTAQSGNIALPCVSVLAAANKPWLPAAKKKGTATKTFRSLCAG